MSKKISIVLIIIIFKLLILFIFYILRDYVFGYFNYFFEKIGLVPEGKQDFFNGMASLFLILKSSIILIDIFGNIIIMIITNMVIKNTYFRKYIYKVLIVLFMILLLGVFIVF